MPRILFDLRCASHPDVSYEKILEVTNGEKLIDIIAVLAKQDLFVRKYIFNLAENRLFPYHIIFVDGELLLPKDLENYKIQEDTTNVKVLPFVSGG